MKTPSVPLAVSTARHPAPADPVRPPGLVARLRKVLAKFSRMRSAQPLDVSVLSPHMQRDLNLHGAADGRLQAQQAWQAHERYRDSRSWRTPL